jgi:hypothetical protein
MAKTLNFSRLPSKISRNNLSRFINKNKPLLLACRKVKNWDENSWDLDGIIPRRPGITRKISIRFTKFNPDLKITETPFDIPFRNFAKAYFLYSQSSKRITDVGFRLTALRALELALLSTTRTAFPEKTSPTILNVAEEYIRRRHKFSSAYHMGRELEELGRFISANRISEIEYSWKSSLPKAKELNRVGKEADERRKKLLPSNAAINAIATCYLHAKDPGDVYIASLLTILLFTSSRIGEILRLPVDCEITVNEAGVERYGLRWLPAKGAPPMIKFIPTQAVSIVKEAISKIKSLTSRAREISKFYNKSQHSIIDPSTQKSFRSNGSITIETIRGTYGNAIAADFRRYLNKQTDSRSANSLVNLENFISYYRSLLPREFPYVSGTNLPFSKSLFIVQQHFLRKNLPDSDSMIQEISLSSLDVQFGKLSIPNASIFSRFGLRESDNSHIILNSHQLRHFTNTNLQKGGASQLDIAMWSGRKDLRQNRSYDHMTSAEMIEMTRNLIPEDNRIGGELQKLSTQLPVSFDDFRTMTFPTAHVTEIGFCLHDYTFQPCTAHRDCINCNSLVCVKGDHTRVERIKQLLASAKNLLTKAIADAELGVMGALRWVQQHEQSVSRYTQYLSELENPDYADGTIIRVYKTQNFTPPTNEFFGHKASHSLQTPKQRSITHG